MNVNKNDVLGLIFYYENSAEIDPGIQDTTLKVLNDVLAAIEEAEAAAKKKRKSPNKSGILQIDPETGKIVAEYKTQNEALEAIGRKASLEFLMRLEEELRLIRLMVTSGTLRMSSLVSFN